MHGNLVFSEVFQLWEDHRDLSAENTQDQRGLSLHCSTINRFFRFRLFRCRNFRATRADKGPWSYHSLMENVANGETTHIEFEMN